MTVIDDLRSLDGWGQRSSTVRFELLDSTNSFLGYVDILSDTPPTIDNNINRAIKRTMTNVRLAPSVTADVNTLTERIRPVWRWQDGTEDHLGIFLFAEASRSVAKYSSAQFASAGDGMLSDTAMTDQTINLEQELDHIIGYRPGTRIHDAVEDVLEIAGVIAFDVDESEARIRGSEWMIWAPGKPITTILNDLCAAGSYYSPYFNNEGVCIVRQVDNLDSVDPAITYKAGLNVYEDSIVETDDLLDAPNRYIVVNTASTDHPVWGVWDLPDSAPHSIANRGIVKTKTFDIQGIETQEEARRAAKAKGRADYSTYRWVNFNTAPAVHDTFDIIGWDGDVYREQSWSLALLEGAPMRHELRRIYSDTAPGTLI